MGYKSPYMRFGNTRYEKDIAKLRQYDSHIREENYKNAEGEWVNTTQWISIVAWGNVAERVENKVKKGLQIAIDGSLHINEWTDDKGQRHSNTEIWIDDFFVIDTVAK